MTARTELVVVVQSESLDIGRGYGGGADGELVGAAGHVGHDGTLNRLKVEEIVGGGGLGVEEVDSEVI